MQRCVLFLGFALAVCISPSLGQAQEKAQSDVERGAAAVRGRPPFVPALWSLAAYENAWKQWGVKEKPAPYEAAFRERYGLHPAPYPNDGLPMGLHLAPGPFGKGAMNDCLLCHAGAVAGKTYIGLGNASLELQGLLDDFAVEGKFQMKVPFQFSSVRGTIDPVSPALFLLSFRDPDLNLQLPAKMDYVADLASDPPAWWQLKKKKTRNWTGGVDARSVRIDMINSLNPLNTGEQVKSQEPIFAAIHAFILSVEPPRYPFAIDEKLAAGGRVVFEKTCARCHGTYGPGGTYPNKIVPLETIGTDRRLAEALSPHSLEYLNRSWFGREKGPDGKLLQVSHLRGYQAPPLDGVWATAPYFHNGSAPTVYHVLNSQSRPRIFTRSYCTGEADYDPHRLGLKIAVLERFPADLPAIERRKIYDTSRPGQNNAGHPFGDTLTEEERMGVIEYLKTL